MNTANDLLPRDADSARNGMPATTAAASSSSAMAGTVPPRPRRLWNVQDTSLKPVPPYYPPMDPNCTALVGDVPPSLVVVRISECLRKRSIAVEYDEESVTARCMTVDRTHFVIQLYRGSPPGGGGGDNAPSHAGTLVVPPPSSVVIVECQRQSGSVTSFHAACRAVLQAARGLETGNDERRSHHTNGMDFASLNCGSHLVKRRKLFHHNQGGPTNNAAASQQRPSLKTSRHASSGSSSSFPAAEAALEAARDLVQKDRLECQQLGMERLVNLTTMDIAGGDTCLHISRRLLRGDNDEDAWLIDFLTHPEAEQAMEEAAAAATTTATFKSRGAGGAAAQKGHSDEGFAATNAALIRSFLETSAAVTPSPKMARNQSFSSYSARALWRPRESEDEGTGLGLSAAGTAASGGGSNLSPDELRHEARLRALALRVLCNALYNLSKAHELQDVLLPKSASASPSTSKRKSRNAASSSVRGAKSSEAAASRLVQPPFLLSLVQDLQGASRPPSVSETGYKLASVHEAALAVRCLRLLAGGDSDDDNSEGGGDDGNDDDDAGGVDGLLTLPQVRVREFLRSEAILERLELARSVGRATHSVLQQEAERTYNQLTEDVRSC